MSDNERIARGSVLSIISELDNRDAEIERLRSNQRAASQQIDELIARLERLNKIDQALSDVADAMQRHEALRLLIRENLLRWGIS
jgi:DNA repair exonuclease SbcCD ATPase subunit